MTWICPECGFDNADDAVKCTCGREKEPPEIPSDQEGAERFKICPFCGGELPAEDEFCSYCGKPVIVLSEEDTRKIRKASKWILVISIMFVVFGTIMGFKQRSVADEAKSNLAQYESSETWSQRINGKVFTVGELRSKIDQETTMIFAVNYFLALIMFVLYLWARRSPFPAMVTALCVYLAVMVLNGILDPGSVFQGIIIKVVFVGAMIAGIKASLAARGGSYAYENR